MTKAFVNKGEKKIDGRTAFESKTKELEHRFRDEKDSIKRKKLIDEEISKDLVLLCDKMEGVLKGVGVIPGTKIDTKNPTTLTIFDDGVPVIQLNKNKVIKTYEARSSTDELYGVNFLIPVSDFAVPIDYQFQHQLKISGDISGLVFFFKD
jgi:hypothetical protein